MQTRMVSPWQLIGYSTLSLRFVQGWIFWGGGSRRFIYDPTKLDPHASVWLGNKLQSAMPGAILGVNDAINTLLHHPTLLFVAVILFSLLELVSGLCLILGFCTRFFGLITALISISLMLIFGWQGSTCMDEWTMAVSNFAMGVTLALTGSAVLSLDALLLKRYERLHHSWFAAISSGPISVAYVRIISFGLLFFTLIFTLLTYNYFRGAILSRYHAGPVSATTHHIKLSHGQLMSEGAVYFTLYVDAGSPAIPDYLIKIELRKKSGEIVETWDTHQLKSPNITRIKNLLPYNLIRIGSNGLVAPVGAKAEINLQPTVSPLTLTWGEYELIVYSVSGKRYQLLLNYQSSTQMA